MSINSKISRMIRREKERAIERARAENMRSYNEKIAKVDSEIKRRGEKP